MKKSPVALACVLLFAATASFAMSLGRNRGAVLVGRPLDVAVQATLEARDDPANFCVEADVYYSDNRLAQGRVRISTERSGGGAQEALIRVQSDLVIDEPVVTIYLRAGCAQRTERRYVLLADMVSDASGAQSLPPTALIVPPRATAAPAAAAVAGPENATAAGRSSAATAPASRPPRAPRASAAPAATEPAVAATAAAPGRAERAASAKSAVVAKNTRAKLKLEPLDLTIERDPQLKSSSELLSVPAATDQERTVAAALYRALSARPEDILKDSEKLQALEASMRDLRSQTLKNQQAIADLNNQLQKAQSERYANLLVYGLGLLLLLALVAIGWLWRRRPAGESVESDELPWWRKNRQADKGWGDSLLDQAAIAAPAPGSSQPPSRGGSAKAAKAAALDLDLGFDNSGDIEVKHMSGHGRRDVSPPTDFAPSGLGGNSSRAVKAEELFDVQQQADFFVSLGQHEQAIEVLRSHILDNGPTSALVYLDLFNLYHQLDRRDDYDALRAEFNQLFNARMPEFETYTVQSPGLESYEVAMGRIEALWPSPKVLEVIEESIFRKPEANTRAFDLEAYRELLLLYAVAREIISPEDNKNDSLLSFDLPDSTLGGLEGKTVKFMATSIQPLSATVAGDEGYGETRPMGIAVMPHASPRLGLDIDLDELAPFDAPAAAPVEPESDSQFFAQFVANLPDSGAATEAPAAAAARDDELGNLIDFDGFDDLPTPKKPPAP